jgi:hypothetical protein
MTLYSDYTKTRKVLTNHRSGTNLQNNGGLLISDGYNSPIGKIKSRRKEGFLNREIDWILFDRGGNESARIEKKKSKELFQYHFTYLISSHNHKLGEIQCQAGIPLLISENNVRIGNRAFIDFSADTCNRIDKRMATCAGLMLLAAIRPDVIFMNFVNAKMARPTLTRGWVTLCAQTKLRREPAGMPISELGSNSKCRC